MARRWHGRATAPLIIDMKGHLMPCPECGSTASEIQQNGTVEVCSNCAHVLWEDL